MPFLFPEHSRKEAKISTVGSRVAEGRASQGQEQALVSHLQLRERQESGGGGESIIEATSFSFGKQTFQVRKEAVPGLRTVASL